jgi:hypothetical protein
MTPETPKPTCPRCGFSFAFDGSTCSHCHFPEKAKYPKNKRGALKSIWVILRKTGLPTAALSTLLILASRFARTYPDQLRTYGEFAIVFFGFCCGFPILFLAAAVLVWAVHWQFVGRTRWWAELQEVRDNTELQAKGRAKGYGEFIGRAKPCPGCKTPADQLVWVYDERTLVAPKDVLWLMEWWTVCDGCRRRVDRFDLTPHLRRPRMLSRYD